MKYYIIFFALLLSGMCRAVSSREALINEATSGNVRTILLLGNESSPEVINSLKTIYHEGGHRAIYAEMALAKLGDRPAFEKICSDLSSEATPAEQDRAINKLQYIATPEAIAVPVSLLEKSKEREPIRSKGSNGEPGLDKQLFLPLSDVAAMSLSKIVPNPFLIKGKLPTAESIAGFLKWWKENQKS